MTSSVVSSDQYNWSVQLVSTVDQSIWIPISTLCLCAEQDLKPDLVFARISGYGQTGPKAQLAGYASVCEAYGGVR